MSTKSQNKSAKKRSHESLDNKEQRNQNILSRCEVESRSSSCGSKKSSKKILKKKISQEGFFNVEKIIGSRIHQGRSFYKVRWQGYNESEDSWEPEDNLMNVLDLIEEFLSSKVDDYDENARGSGGSRIRSVGGYEYVPSNKVVAHKTKYFDDIRDGKIDLTKNDLYSRVKTRKRLQSDTIDITENLQESDSIITEIIEESTSSTVPNNCDKSRYYQSNLFEMTAEFMRNNNFDKGLTALVSKSSTNDDISSFNCSISPNTNQSDDLLPQVSPIQVHMIPECLKKSMATQTELLEINEEIAAVQNTEIVKPHVQKIIQKIDESIERKGPPERLVTSESYLLSLYAKEIKLSNKSAILLPRLHIESDLISVDSFDDLKTAIILNKYNLINSAFESGIRFDLSQLFSPENITPLHMAVSKNQFNIVRLLLRNGSMADCSLEDHCQETPLMLASSCGYVHVVKALLDHGAFTDCRGYNGKNALCVAIENGRIDVVKMLLQYGTNFFKVTEQQSAMSLINDLHMSNKLSQAISIDLRSLVRAYYLSFTAALNRTVNRYLTKQMAKQSCTIFPYQWIDVFEQEYHVDFLLDDSVIVNLDSPILLLVHGIQAECNFEFWIENNCCCVDSVLVNGERQSSLTGGNFITTLWPLHANNNRLTVRFTDRSLLSREEKHIRVAIVALSITNGSSTVNNVNTSFHLASHCRQYH